MQMKTKKGKKNNECPHINAIFTFLTAGFFIFLAKAKIKIKSISYLEVANLNPVTCNCFFFFQMLKVLKRNFIYL